MIRRITPSMVVEAYEMTGIEPKRGTFAEYSKGYAADKPCAGCALTALYLLENEGKSPNGGDIRDWAEEQFGFQYTCGFIFGYDDKVPSWTSADDFREGYDDGEAAAAVIFPTTS